MTITGPEPGEVRRVFTSLWWVVLLRGVLMTAFGIFMIAWPEPALVAFVWLFGIYAVLDGVASLVHVLRTRSHIGMGAGLGVVSLLAGAIALIWPNVTAVVILLIVALWMLLLGIIQLAAGFTLRTLPGSGWGWLVASGVASLLLGFLLFAAPGDGLLAILTFFGVLMAVAGVALIIGAVMARRFISHRV